MAKIYLATAGSYSDYGIDSVFSTKEKAEARVAFLKEWQNRENDAWVEEWEIDAEPAKEVKTITVYLWADGVVDSTFKYADEYNKQGFNGYYYGSWREISVPISGPMPERSPTETFGYSVLTEDVDTAIKVAAEKMTIVQANKAWGNNELTKQVLGQ